LFIGYDSAAGHVASACGVPQIAIMNGFASERMLARWRPNGAIIRGDAANPLASVEQALAFSCSWGGQDGGTGFSL
jgi:ADP-heptose:LPS heptosyltransferase